MEVIGHRINKIQKLKTINPIFGVEIDLRSYGNDLILSHDPYKKGDKFEDFIKEYRHGTLVLNIKESGIESAVIALIQKYNTVKNFFLLDVEFPYVFSASKNGLKNIAIRFSEFESINTLKRFRGLIDWVWIDTFTKLPLNQKSLEILKYFKTCLVCPERWQRPEDISFYKTRLKKMKFSLDAVMTSENTIKFWL